MKYNSIGEYFYRLSNRCLGFAILPVILVWAAFLLNQNFFSGLLYLEVKDGWLIRATIGTGLLLLIVFLTQANLAKVRLRRFSAEPSLGLRIQMYISVVMIRFRFFSLMLLVIGTGIFLTTELIFLYLLPVPVISFVFYWPGRWRMARDLKLKPEEKEILKNSALGV